MLKNSSFLMMKIKISTKTHSLLPRSLARLKILHTERKKEMKEITNQQILGIAQGISNRNRTTEEHQNLAERITELKAKMQKMNIMDINRTCDKLDTDAATFLVFLCSIWK